jgi:hypothetical protein
MSMHDPITFSKVVRSFIDIFQNEGWLPECRDAGQQQWVQGGSSELLTASFELMILTETLRLDADPILAEFYVKFKDHAKKLQVEPSELWDALVQDAEVESPNWDIKGRQAEIWKTLGTSALPLCAV